MSDIKILLADDHQVITDGLKALLDKQPGFHVSATASNGAEAMEFIKILDFDIVLMDIDMPIMNGLDATVLIKKIKNSPKVIILSMHSEKGMVEELIANGVDGYLLKNTGKEELVNAIKTVMSGNKYFDSGVTFSLLNKNSTVPKIIDDFDLTERELEILRLIADGFTNKEIGEKLFISHRTVDTHRTNLMRKLEVNNIAGLISFAIKNKLIV